MNKLAIFGTKISSIHFESINEIISKLHIAGFEITIQKSFFEYFCPTIDSSKYTIFTEITENTADLVLSFGGDGTFLKCAHLFYKFDIPILGINFGKLGFLAEVNPLEINDIINDLLNKNYKICNRSVLDFKIENQDTYIQGIGLNEIALQKSNNLRVIKLNIYIDNDFLCSFWGDGVLISTPTGSTGYSLSLGGPIMSPKSQTLLITPIAAHTLNIRPIIVPDNSNITIEAEGEHTDFLVSNDFNSILLEKSPQIIIKKSEFVIKTIQLNTITFFQTLRNKLQLGIDIRK